MNIITLNDIEKSYGTRLLFTGVTMTFTDNQKWGLVGINGTGKSTFLQVLSGHLDADKGSIEKNGKSTIYYMPQMPVFDDDSTLLDAVLSGDHPKLQLVRQFEHVQDVYRTHPEDETASRQYMQLLERMDREDGWQVEQEARIILNKLGFSDVMRTMGTLSGGQKRRIALGQALLYPCDLLLLDEPTNHLDESTIDWLETYLSNRPGGLLISTHDRYFLDAVCNGIVELSRRHMYQYKGNYETFMRLKAEREAMQAATEEKRRQFLKREIEWVRRGAQARSTKQKARLQRFEALQKMERTARVDAMDPVQLKSRLGKTIFDMEHVSYAVDGKQMVKDFTYHVVRHDRIGIVGPNGVGKTTFMRLLEGTLQPQGGTMGRGETVRIGHFTQELPPMDPNMRVLDYIREDYSYVVLGDGTHVSAGQMLERFLFTSDMHGVRIGKLSGGEKRRLFLLKLLMGAPNVLLLDEPTNDLDIPTLEVLEDFLDNFAGVIITVCHDRYFLDRVVDKVFVFTGHGHIDIVHGSYSEYREEHPLEEIQVSTKGGSGDTRSKERVCVAEDTTKKPLNKGEEKEYKQLLETIDKLEHEIKGLDVMVAHAGSDFEQMQSLLAEKEVLLQELERLTERWMELEVRID